MSVFLVISNQFSDTLLIRSIFFIEHKYKKKGIFMPLYNPQLGRNCCTRLMYGKRQFNGRSWACCHTARKTDKHYHYYCEYFLHERLLFFVVTISNSDYTKAW